MKSDSWLVSEGEIAREILAYLRDHPDAEDTLEGIEQWWLLERKIVYHREILRMALTELSKSGKVEVVRSKDKILYRANRKTTQLSGR